MEANAVTLYNDRSSNIESYAKFGIVGTSSLAFREVPELFQKYVVGNVGIDYGCGAGRSTRFLRQLNLDVTGMDISEQMLAQAKQLDKENAGSFIKIDSGVIPVAKKTQDFIFSSFVFLVLSKEEMPNVLNGMHQALKDDGVVIISTGSEKIHDPKMNWISYHTNYEQNQNLESGNIVKLGIKATGAVFDDYNWLDIDYHKFFEESGFEVIEQRNPLGYKTDSEKWESELEHSPCTVYVLKKRG